VTRHEAKPPPAANVGGERRALDWKELHGKRARIDGT